MGSIALYVLLSFTVWWNQAQRRWPRGRPQKK